MTVREGARRIGVMANCMMTLSLVLLLCWWKLSAVLFVAAWLVYGAAYVLEGFASDALSGQTAGR